MSAIPRLSKVEYEGLEESTVRLPVRAIYRKTAVDV